ncbi:MAG: hypothetical protein AAF735_05500 [Myxococcota bacterium]
MRTVSIVFGLSVLFVTFGFDAKAQTFIPGPGIPTNFCLLASDTTNTPAVTRAYDGGLEVVDSDEDNYPNCGFVVEYTNTSGGSIPWSIGVQNAQTVSREACESSWISARAYGLSVITGQWITLKRETVSGVYSPGTFGATCSIAIGGTTSWVSKIRLVGDASHKEAEYPYLPSQQIAVTTSVGEVVIY